MNSTRAEAKHLKGFKYYEPVKPTPFEFKPHPMMAKSNHASTVHHLQKRINELESSHKSTKDQLNSLQSTNTALANDLERMQTLNKQLLSEKLSISSTDMHYHVQELLLSEAKDRTSAAMSEVAMYREEAERQRLKAEEALRENRKLESAVKRYRRLLATDLVKTRVNSAETSFSMISRVDSVDTGTLKSLECKLEELAKQTSPYHTLSSLISACKLVLHCQECTLFMLKPPAAKTVHKTVLEGTWLYYHPECDESQPVFNNVQCTKNGLFNNDHLVLPCYVDSQLVCIVQNSFPTQSSFSVIHETLLRILVQGAAKVLKKVQADQKQSELYQRLMGVSRLTAECARANTLDRLGETVYSVLPSLAKCDAASLLLCISGGFTRVYPRTLRYASLQGVSASVLASQSTLAFKELGKESEFSAEIDDPFGLKDTACVMACLPNNSGQVVGLLQLFNKDSRDELVESIKVVLGCCIERLS